MDRHGQINIDAADLMSDLLQVANLLSETSRVTFTLSGCSTRYEITAINYAWLALSAVGAPPQGNSYEHTLWIIDSRVHGFMWLDDTAEHVPTYLAEKLNADDGTDTTIIATAIALVDALRALDPARLETAKERIRSYWQRLGRVADGPTFLNDNPTERTIT